MIKINIFKHSLAFIFFAISFLGFSFAENIINFEQFFTQYFDTISNNIPETYKYISLNYKNVKKDTPLYSALQKAVYLDLLPNANVEIPLNTNVKQEIAVKLVNIHFGINIPFSRDQYVSKERLETVLALSMRSLSSQEEFSIQSQIMKNVYETLTNNYIDSQDLNTTKLEYGAIQGMVSAVGDKYTVFFPPQEAKEFNQQLEGEYEGIGAYVDMPEPGKFIIISPFTNSPAEKAGLLPGDIVTHVNGEAITNEMTSETVIGKIKGPAGTDIKLTILRGDKIIDFVVTRQKVEMPIVDSKKLEDNICYIKINIFGFGSADLFAEKLKELPITECKKYIFDLRNNPGGNLEDVARMLDYMVPTNEPSVVIKYKNTVEKMFSEDVSIPKLTDQKIIILINKGSASASEIFAGTFREYGTKTILIGEQSFGKGTVQEAIPYQDGSMLKYTIAKRYTGKKEININGTGISPDIIIQDNKSTSIDEVLENAKTYNFNNIQ